MSAPAAGTGAAVHGGPPPPPPGAPPGAGAGAGAARRGRGSAGGEDWKWAIARAVLVYFAMQFVLSRWMPKTQPGTAQDGSKDAAAAAAAATTTTATATAEKASAQPKGPQLPLGASLWEPGQALDLYVFLVENGPPTHLEIRSQYSQWTHYGLGPWAHSISTNIDFDAPEYQPLLRPTPAAIAASGQHKPILSLRGGKGRPPAVKFPHIAFNHSNLDFRVDFGEFAISDAVRTGNHSLWAEILLCTAGTSPNPADPSHSPLTAHRQRKLLTRLFARKRRRIERNLFDKSNDTLAQIAEEEDDFDDKNPPIGAHWHRNLSLALVPFEKDQRTILAQEPPPSVQFIFPVMDPNQAQQAAHYVGLTGDHNMRFQLPVLKVENAPADTAYHYPVIFPNDFWLLRQHMYPINKTVHSLPFHINLYKTSAWKFKLQSNMNEGWERAQNGQATGLGGQAGSAEIDMLKSVLLETSPWWLVLTVLVSILHSVFEILAFSSDIGDWRKKDDLSGISIGSIMTNVVTQIIILLYLLDSSEETSFMIILSQGAGAAIEAWKLTKAIKVAVVPTPRDAKGVLALLPYQFKILNKRVMSEEEKKTAEYDRLAFKIVGTATIPLLSAYAVYSAVYQQHRGLWSYIITTLTSYTIALGFTAMVPQLIVNYQCKSTAGFTTKTLIFKILSTVVDDFYAFAIPQPLIYRLAAFRDDVIFLIFLYQRWIYGVDPTRRNELGEVVDKEGAKRKELAAAAAAASGKKNGNDTATAAAGAADENGAEATTSAVAKGPAASAATSRKKGGT